MYESLSYTLATILLTVIEYYLRIKPSHGEVVNVSKNVSKILAVVFFVPIVILFKMYGWYVIPFALCCVGIRGVFYDPFLNIWFDRKIDNESLTTNSKGDFLERKLGLTFWKQRIFYLLVFIINFCIYNFLKTL